MKKKDIKILLISQDEQIHRQINEVLSQASQRYVVTLVNDFDRAKKLFNSDHYDLFLVDAIGFNKSFEILQFQMKTGLVKPIIMITDEGGNELDVTLKAGATDYLIKSQLNAPVLERSIKHSIEIARIIERLHEKEQIYRDLFEKSIDAIYFINKSKQFVDVNPAMLSLFGYTKDEMLQLELRHIFSNLEQKKIYRRIMNQKEVVKNFEAELKKKNGEKIFAVINATCQKDINDNIIGYQGVIHDVTERKKSMQELIKNERLALTGKITRSIAHEVRNPLTNINLALEQLIEEFPENDMEFYTDIISRSCTRINNLITQLMQTTKPSELDLQEYPMNQLLDESLQLVSDRMQLQQVRIIKNYKAGSQKFAVDPQKLKIAFLNLLVNALDAVPEDKGVIIVSTEIKNGKCMVSIEDNGAGIEEDMLDNLFAPFATGKRGGMGLGLTSTQNIIESHNGEIVVESEPSKGTKFIVMLDVLVPKKKEETIS